jgi:DNA repair photolyase
MQNQNRPAPAATLVFMPRGAFKGRGTAWAIEHRFTREHHESLDDGWGALERAALEEQSAPETQIIEQTVKSILSGNDSPDIPFDLSINPYRGCEHGCVYCFARPTHSYLDLSPGLDFETRIIAKVNAAERLRAALSAKAYAPLPLNIGSATDAYQPAERRLRITRSVIEVLVEFRHAFSIITKSAGIERDIDLLAPLARENLTAVYVSIPTLDGALARIMEPRAAAPERRLKTIEKLARAGIPVGVSVSPLIPFINEPELEQVLECARAEGATSAFATVLRLPWEVNPLFQQWLQTHFPDRAARVMARVHELRGGHDNDPRFHARMTGQGPWGDLLAQRFAKATARLGLRSERRALDLSAFRQPSIQAPAPRQATLF